MITARRDVGLIDSESAENIINNINRYIDVKYENTMAFYNLPRSFSRPNSSLYQ